MQRIPGQGISSMLHDTAKKKKNKWKETRHADALPCMAHGTKVWPRFCLSCPLLPTSTPPCTPTTDMPRPANSALLASTSPSTRTLLPSSLHLLVPTYPSALYLIITYSKEPPLTLLSSSDPHRQSLTHAPVCFSFVGLFTVFLWLTVFSEALASSQRTRGQAVFS